MANFEQSVGIGLQGLEREAAERREREERIAEETARELRNIRMLVIEQPRNLRLVAHSNKALLQGEASVFLRTEHTQSRGRFQVYPS